MKQIHLSNEAGRNAKFALDWVKEKETAKLGLEGKALVFRKYVAATDSGMLPALEKRFGDKIADALLEGDPEIDREVVGRAVGETYRIYLAGDGEVLHAAPKIVEVIFDAEGAEKERRDPVHTEGNVQEEAPVRVTRQRMKRSDAILRFAFKRTVAIRHIDGLSYDFLHAMATELDEADEVVLLAAGPKGRDPLIFQDNGVPYRGFLEGRVDGPRYKLLLHLSNLELKRPSPSKEKEA
jgi:hypothetical protein